MNTPILSVLINTGNLEGLPQNSLWFQNPELTTPEKIKHFGFDGVQTPFEQIDDYPQILTRCTLDRINTPQEAELIIAKHASKDVACLTVHAGWGIEDDAEVDQLIRSILDASQKHQLPVYIETHRATVTQDIWRTVQLCKRFPDIRFNGDLSHYYCGQELVYGGLEMKLDFMTPILERIDFMHARISNPGNIQAAIGAATGKPVFATGDTDYLADFKHMWTRVMSLWLQRAKSSDTFFFCPELLSPQHYYARTYRNAKGEWEEESDRFHEAMLYKQIAEECFESAQHA